MCAFPGQTSAGFRCRQQIYNGNEVKERPSDAQPQAQDHERGALGCPGFVDFPFASRVCGYVVDRLVLSANSRIRGPCR